MSEHIDQISGVFKIIEDLKKILAELDTLSHHEVAAIRIDEAIQILSEPAESGN